MESREKQKQKRENEKPKVEVKKVEEIIKEEDNKSQTSQHFGSLASSKSSVK
jgi:hypothetical protein